MTFSAWRISPSAAPSRGCSFSSWLDACALLQVRDWLKKYMTYIHTFITYIQTWYIQYTAIVLWMTYFYNDFGAMLVTFRIQVENCKNQSWKFESFFGIYVGSCKAQMEVWEVQKPQGKNLERLGLAQEQPGTRILVPHGPNLHQVGTNLGPAWGPTWANLEPTWIQVESR